jgi:hypothetical protein
MFRFNNTVIKWVKNSVTLLKVTPIYRAQLTTQLYLRAAKLGDGPDTTLYLFVISIILVLVIVRLMVPFVKPKCLVGQVLIK